MTIDLDDLSTLPDDSPEWRAIRFEVMKRGQKKVFKGLNITQNKDQQVTWYADGFSDGL